MTRANERRPVARAASEAGRPETSVATTTDVHADFRADPAAFLAGYDCGAAVVELEAEARGRRAGYADGRADEAAERDAADAAAAEVAHRRHAAWIASMEPYADLCDRRGHHERAERQRAILRARGIA